MLNPSANSIICDGCGQTASPEHIARRLERLEMATRWRPIHIGTLFLGAISPKTVDEFLYAGQFRGEAGCLLEAAGIATAGKPADSVLSEFKRGGFFLAHILECPLKNSASGFASSEALIAMRVSATAARIRRSLKPKCIALISEHLAALTARLASAELGCPLLLDGGLPFALDAGNYSEATRRLQEALNADATVGS